MRLGVPVGLSAFLLLALAGCSTQLAPAFDQSISTELATANNDIQALFVSVGTSVESNTFPSRNAAYDHIVAELNAVELQIKARPIPNADALEKADKVLTSLKIANFTFDPNFSDYPSARSVHDLADTIGTMEKADKKAGLRGNELKAFKNQATIYLTQSITYENFLKR